MNTNDDDFTELVDELQAVDETSLGAQDNEISISDNNGGRIELSEDGTGEGYIRK